MHDPDETRRFPWLDEAARGLLCELLEHPRAPVYNHWLGDRLTAAGLARVREWERRLRDSGGARWGPEAPPPWLAPYVRRCLEEVPAYRRYGLPHPPEREPLRGVPAFGRSELAAEPWSYVPDGTPLDDLVVYETSGTTGRRMLVPTHPEAPAMYLPLLRALVEKAGGELPGGRGVPIVGVCFQAETFVFAVVSAYLDGAAYVKLNLHPNGWRSPDDVVPFLEYCRPAVFTGDPVAFEALAALPLEHRPRALVSSASALLPALARRLRERFGCPVLDLYSLTETGPIAAADPDDPACFRVLPHDIYVEILDEEGAPLPPGVPGEVVVTGGRNAYLPLLRYRTGDFASLEFRDGRPRLVGLEGRRPVRFRRPDGTWVNSVDVTWALRPLDLSQFALHQDREGSFRLRVRGDENRERLRAALEPVLGSSLSLRVEPIPNDGRKVVQYSTDLGEEL